MSKMWRIVLRHVKFCGVFLLTEAIFSLLLTVNRYFIIITISLLLLLYVIETQVLMADPQALPLLPVSVNSDLIY